MLTGTIRFKEGDDRNNRQLISYLRNNLIRLLSGSPGIQFRFNVDAELTGAPLLIIQSNPIKKFAGIVQIENVLNRFLSPSAPSIQTESSVEAYQQSVLGDIMNPDKKTIRVESDEPEEDMSKILQSRMQAAIQRRHAADPNYGKGADIPDPLANQNNRARDSRADNVEQQMMDQKAARTPPSIVQKTSAVEILKKSRNKDDDMLMAKFMDGQMSEDGNN